MTPSLPLLRLKMPELDALRGIAILLVVFYHGFFWSSNLVGLTGLPRLAVNATRLGWLGVNLFFVLSGFLITGILEDSKNSPHFFRRFYIRRALRILPAYYGLLLLLAFVPLQNGSYLLLSCF
jgi:peptidoglycan/LPS O-acetylase OafA/YrhL